MLAGLSQAVPPVTDPVSDVLKRLDYDMESVLNKKDVPLTTKFDKYNEVLTNYLAKVREYKGYSSSRDTVYRRPNTMDLQPPPPPPTAQPHEREVEREVLERGVGDQYLSMITDKYRSKAKRMLNFLNTIPNVSWTPMGELKVGDRVIENSHAVDLLSRAVKPPSRAANPPPIPTGWYEFAQVLKQHNAPKDMVGAALRKEWTGPSFVTSPPGGVRRFFGEKSPVSSTPPPRKRLRVERERPKKTRRGLRWETVQ